MPLEIEDLKDPSRFRELYSLPYSEMVEFVVEYIRKNTPVMIFYWSLCLVFFAIGLTVRINISGYFQIGTIMLHSLLGFILFPVILIPVHELMHVIPFLLTGARRIRIGADLKQYIFYVTAHRNIMNSAKFIFVALVPFFIITAGLLLMVFMLPGLWKWSLSALLFVHTTMCAGDFAMLNFYYHHRHRKIYTYDDADEKMAYFYEAILPTTQHPEPNTQNPEPRTQYPEPSTQHPAPREIKTKHIYNEETDIYPDTDHVHSGAGDGAEKDRQHS